MTTNWVTFTCMLNVLFFIDATLSPYLKNDSLDLNDICNITASTGRQYKSIVKFTLYGQHQMYQ